MLQFFIFVVTLSRLLFRNHDKFENLKITKLALACIFRQIDGRSDKKFCAVLYTSFYIFNHFTRVFW